MRKSAVFSLRPQFFFLGWYNIGLRFITKDKIKDIESLKTTSFEDEELTDLIKSCIGNKDGYILHKLDEELKKTISYLSETLFFYGFLIEDKVVCLEAIEYYMKIQHDIENLADNELKSEIFNYIGMIYRKLSNFENKIENLESSKKYYKKALEIINKESEEYGVVLNNLALVYQNLSDLIDFKENLIKSLSNYNKALKFLTKKNDSIIKNIKKNILIIIQKLEKFENQD